jgi:hypothetical protein
MLRLAYDIYVYVLNFLIVVYENNVDIVMLDNDEWQKLLSFLPKIFFLLLKNRYDAVIICLKIFSMY